MNHLKKAPTNQESPIDAVRSDSGETELRGSPSWVSKMIVDPASKLIFAGAHLLSLLARKVCLKFEGCHLSTVADMDDPVILSQTSPTQSIRRNSRVIEVIDDESVSQTGSSGYWAKSVAKGLGTSLSVPQPKEPSFSCPVSMGTLLEETSTKCRHIFCKKCISMAITTQSKCSTCRQKLNGKDTFRIYLPTC